MGFTGWVAGGNPESEGHGRTRRCTTASGGHVLGCPADPAGKSRLGKRSGEREDDTTRAQKVNSAPPSRRFGRLYGTFRSVSCHVPTRVVRGRRTGSLPASHRPVCGGACGCPPELPPCPNKASPDHPDRYPAPSAPSVTSWAGASLRGERDPGQLVRDRGSPRLDSRPSPGSHPRAAGPCHPAGPTSAAPPRPACLGSMTPKNTLCSRGCAASWRAGASRSSFSFPSIRGVAFRTTLGTRTRGTQRAAAEQPCRSVGLSVVTLLGAELDRLLAPASEIHGTADDERVVPADITRLTDVAQHHPATTPDEHLRIRSAISRVAPCFVA